MQKCRQSRNERTNQTAFGAPQQYLVEMWSRVFHKLELLSETFQKRETISVTTYFNSFMQLQQRNHAAFTTVMRVICDVSELYYVET